MLFCNFNHWWLENILSADSQMGKQEDTYVKQVRETIGACCKKRGTPRPVLHAFRAREILENDSGTFGVSSPEHAVTLPLSDQRIKALQPNLTRLRGSRAFSAFSMYLSVAVWPQWLFCGDRRHSGQFMLMRISSLLQGLVRSYFFCWTDQRVSSGVHLCGQMHVVGQKKASVCVRSRG